MKTIYHFNEDNKIIVILIKINQLKSIKNLKLKIKKDLLKHVKAV